MAYRFICPAFIHGRVCHVWSTGCESTFFTGPDPFDYSHVDSQSNCHPTSITDTDSHSDTAAYTDTSLGDASS